MKILYLIRAVNGKAITARAALQIIRHQKKSAYSNTPPPVSSGQGWLNNTTGEIFKRNPKNTSWQLVGKIAVLDEQIRQELG